MTCHCNLLTDPEVCFSDWIPCCNPRRFGFNGRLTMNLQPFAVCMVTTWLAGGFAAADIHIGGGRMTNPGTYPFKAGESVGAFIARIDGIKPTVYEGQQGPFPYPITKLRIWRDKRWSDKFSLTRDAVALWKYELKDGDMIDFLDLSLFSDDDFPKKWQGAYRDEWTIRMPKPPEIAAERVFSLSLFDSEPGYRKVLMEAFPGLKEGCYHFSGKRMIGVFEDFDHDRVMLVFRPGAHEKPNGVTVNGKKFDMAESVPAVVKVYEMLYEPGGPVDDTTRILEDPIGHWIPMEATDRLAVRIQLLYPDRGLFTARYDPDDGWCSAYELPEAAETKPSDPPADAYELTRKSLLARVLQVLEQKPECVVRTRSNPDLKFARIPEGFWDREIEPLQVSLTDVIRIGYGESGAEADSNALVRTFEMYCSAASSARASPRVVVHIGKHASDQRFREFLAAIREVDVRLVHLANDPYESFLGCSASARAVLQQIEALSVPTIDLPKQSLTDAIATLQQIYANGKTGGAINWVVKGPTSLEPTAKTEPMEKAVSLRAKGLTFAAAIDNICVQADCEWWIDLDDEEGPPRLVIRQRGLPQKPEP